MSDGALQRKGQRDLPAGILPGALLADAGDRAARRQTVVGLCGRVALSPLARAAIVGAFRLVRLRSGGASVHMSPPVGLAVEERFVRNHIMI